MKRYLLVFLLLLSFGAHAEIGSVALLDNVLDKYAMASSQWGAVVISHASWLYWTLVAISMVWTFGMMALKQADIGEFFAEFIRFTVFVGFFWWLLVNGPAFADSIMRSLRQIAGEATALGGNFSPSNIVDIGFAVVDRVLEQSTLWSPFQSAAGLVVACVILIVLALIGVNMLLLLISGWILAYGGVFFLGFGGSRWTSEFAINYYKTVLGLAAQLYAMVLIVGIGKTFLDDYYLRMQSGLQLREMLVLMIVSIILLVLTNKIPQLLSGIITGASISGAGIGSFSAGALAGAGGMAAAAASVGASAVASGATQALGGAQAVKTAFDAAREGASSGADIAKSASEIMSGVESSSSSEPAFGPGFGQVAKDTAINLARGGTKAASDALASKVDSIYGDINGTAGGKVASAIKDLNKDNGSSKE